MTNPQLQAVHAFIQQQLAAAAAGQTLEQMRANVDAAGKLAPQLPGVSYEPIDAGGVPAAWAAPDDKDPERAVLYIHGGGYTLGSVESYRDFACRIALAARAPTLVVGYRLAPEHPYPAALDDALASYRWLTSEGGFSASKVALVGESAGGGLTLSLALAIRDAADLELPGAVAAMSPWIDLTCSSPSMTADDDPSMMLPYVQQMAMAYLGGKDAKTPGASPLYADHAGLPAILLQAGTHDGLRDDVGALAAKCRDAGVDVSVELFDDMFHAFQIYAAMLDDAKQALEQLGAFVRARTS